MVERREKLRRNWYKLKEEVFKKQLGILTRFNRLSEHTIKSVVAASHDNTIYDRTLLVGRGKPPSYKSWKHNSAVNNPSTEGENGTTTASGNLKNGTNSLQLQTLVRRPIRGDTAGVDSRRRLALDKGTSLLTSPQSNSVEQVEVSVEMRGLQSDSDEMKIEMDNFPEKRNLKHSGRKKMYSEWNANAHKLQLHDRNRDNDAGSCVKTEVVSETKQKFQSSLDQSQGLMQYTETTTKPSTRLIDVRVHDNLVSDKVILTNDRTTRKTRSAYSSSKTDPLDRNLQSVALNGGDRYAGTFESNSVIAPDGVSSKQNGNTKTNFLGTCRRKIQPESALCFNKKFHRSDNTDNPAGSSPHILRPKSVHSGERVCNSLAAVRECYGLFSRKLQSGDSTLMPRLEVNAGNKKGQTFLAGGDGSQILPPVKRPRGRPAKNCPKPKNSFTGSQKRSCPSLDADELQPAKQPRLGSEPDPLVLQHASEENTISINANTVRPKTNSSPKLALAKKFKSGAKNGKPWSKKKQWRKRGPARSTKKVHGHLYSRKGDRAAFIKHKTCTTLSHSKPHAAIRRSPRIHLVNLNLPHTTHSAASIENNRHVRRLFADCETDSKSTKQSTRNGHLARKDCDTKRKYSLRNKQIQPTISPFAASGIAIATNNMDDSQESDHEKIDTGTKNDGEECKLPCISLSQHASNDDSEGRGYTTRQRLQTCDDNDGVHSQNHCAIHAGTVQVAEAKNESGQSLVSSESSLLLKLRKQKMLLNDKTKSISPINGNVIKIERTQSPLWKKKNTSTSRNLEEATENSPSKNASGKENLLKELRKLEMWNAELRPDLAQLCSTTYMPRRSKEHLEESVQLESGSARSKEEKPEETQPATSLRNGLRSAKTLSNELRISLDHVPFDALLNIQETLARR